MAHTRPSGRDAAPGRDCARCPRLVEFRLANRAAFPAWHNAPVPSFGDLDARLLIVGLAPGLRGANRTGRPFTGDFAGDLLYATLIKYGFARGAYAGGRDDGAWACDDLVLVGARITNAVRCVPPQNKPEPAEIKTCRSFLVDELAVMPRLQVILALGKIAHNAVFAALGLKVNGSRFAHGATHELPAGRMLADSYHCSRYNTNTGRLTRNMFESVFDCIDRRLQSHPG